MYFLRFANFSSSLENMNTIRKSIHIAIVITYWQFSVVQIGAMNAKFWSKNNNNVYPALEMTADSAFELYTYQDDGSSNQSYKFLYFCPPQNKKQWHEEVTASIKKPVLFLVETSSKRKDVKCDKPVVPFVTLGDVVRCGINDRGTRHYVYIELFYSAKYFKDAGWRSIKMKEYDNLRKNLSTIASELITIIPIYWFCFDHNTHQTTFASYTLTSPNQTQPMPQNLDTRLTENDQLFFGLDDAPLCYKKENQSFGADFGTNIGDDYLVEQMLVPRNDLIAVEERGCTKNYINIAPQWESLREDWHNLNLFIKNHSEQRHCEIMCGTYGEFKHIRMGKMDVDERPHQQQTQLDQLTQSNHHDPNDDDPVITEHPSELELASITDETGDSNESKKLDFTLTAPLYWWKLVKRGDEAIALIMPNYPKGLDSSSDVVESFCADICDANGWADVKRINSSIVCCQPTPELMAKFIGPKDALVPANVLSLGAA